MKRLALLLSILFCFALSAHATTRYVDGTLAADCIKGEYSIANRTCTGADGDAYNTIAESIAVMAAGDTTYIRSGTYTSITFTNINAAAAAWGSAMTFARYSGDPVDSVIISIYINITGTTRYIILDGLVVDGGHTWPYGCVGGNPYGYIRVQNCELKNGARCGAQHNATPGMEYINCRIHDNGTDYLDHGIYLYGVNCLIDRCMIYNNSGYGVQLYGGDISGTIVRNNLIYNNGTLSEGLGAIIVGNATTTPVQILNNIIYDTTSKTNIAIDIDYGGIADGTLIYNNTIDHATTGVHVAAGADNTEIKNTIIYNCGTTITDDLCGGKPCVSEATNYTGASPAFVNQAAHDYHLQTGSPCVGTGTTLTYAYDIEGRARPQGAAWDIGAYETPEATAPPGATSLTYDSTVSGSTATAALTLSTVIAEAYEIAVAGFTTNAAVTVTSVVRNGQDFVLSGTAASGSYTVWQYYLTNPTVGTYDTVITLSGTSNLYGGVVAYKGANMLDPVGTTVTATDGGGFSPPITVTATTAAGQVVIDAAFLSSAVAATVGANQTERVNINANQQILISTQAGADGGVMSWTWTGVEYWGTVATPLKPTTGATAIQKASMFLAIP